MRWQLLNRWSGLRRSDWTLRKGGCDAVVRCLLDQPLWVSWRCSWLHHLRRSELWSCDPAIRCQCLLDRLLWFWQRRITCDTSCGCIVITAAAYRWMADGGFWGPLVVNCAWENLHQQLQAQICCPCACVAAFPLMLEHRACIDESRGDAHQREASHAVPQLLAQPYPGAKRIT